MTAPALAAAGLATVGVTTRLQRRYPLLAQLVRFMMVGGLGTALNAGLFLVATLWLDSLAANLVALLLSTVVSTEVNRRFTFGGVVADPWRVHVQNSGTVLFYAFYSSIVLLVLEGYLPNASPVLESVTISAASVLGGTARFLVLRYWVFIRPRASV